jgi:dTDP-4-amino-4,6-dideoxygalactose transaminase
LPFPLDLPNCALYARARQGLFHGLTALGISPGDQILVPAYHHGSEVEAFERAGANCLFYGGTADLEPDPQELEALLGSRVRALHLVHYLGFPQDASRWREWCDERELALIEDGAQAWLGSRDGRPVGSFGDLAIFSLYKTVPVPDGGAAVCRVALSPPRSGGHLGARGLARRHGAWIARSAGVAGATVSRLRGPGAGFDARREFELGDAGEPASRTTRLLLPRVCDPAIPEIRREWYRHLLERLGEHVPRPFDRLPEGACPWLFPVTASDKPALLGELERRDIRAMNLWSVPHPSLPVERFPDVASRRAATVGLPVHQGLSRRALDRIAAATLSDPSLVATGR